MKALNAVLTIVIAASLILASCAAPANTDGSADTAAPADGSVVEETTEDPLKDSLPEVKYDGRSFTFFVQTYNLDYYDIETLTGEIIDDAVYARNMAVEDRFDVSIATVDMNGDWNSRTAFMNSIRNCVSAGDNAYDVVAPEYYYGEELVLEGLYMDLYKLEHLDFSKPWWTAGYNEQAELYGKLFAAVGSLALSQVDGTNILYFNKQLAQTYNTGDLYGVVNDGKWTYEKFLSIVEGSCEDIDGDGKYTAADQFGYTLEHHGPRSFVTNFELDYVNLDEDGNPVIVFYTERMLDSYAKIYELVNGTQSVYFNNDAANILPIFQESRALFMTLTLYYVQQLRDMDIDFGFLPMPKYDENQEEYRTTPVGTDLYSVLTTAPDTEFVSVILEALNAETYRNVYPKFYDIALKTKLSRDEESGVMLDIVMDSLYYDFGFINGSNLNYLADYFGNNITGKVADYASYWAANEKQYQKSLEKLIETYQSMN